MTRARAFRDRPALLIGVRAWTVALLAAALVMLGHVSGSTPETSAQSVTGPTTITFVGDIPSPMSGDSFDLAVVLRGFEGVPVPDATIDFTVGDHVRRGRTGADGVATVTFNAIFVANKYDAVARFDGATTRGFAATEQRTPLTIQSIPVRVTTVPPAAGVRLLLGTQELTTGLDGVASGSVPVSAKYNLSVVSTEGSTDPNTRWRFRRWRDANTETTRELDLPRERSLQLGLQILKRVNINVRDTRGTPVDPLSLAALNLRTGRDEVLSARASSVFVAVNDLSTTPDGLVATPATYATADIAFPSIPPFNLAAQRFSFAENGSLWTIQVPAVVTVELEKLHGVSGKPFTLSARVRHRDGTPASDIAVVFEFDGRTVQGRSDEDGLAEARVSTPLATGSYGVSATVVTSARAPYASVPTRSAIAVVPVLFRLQTVPPIANVPITFGGREYATDEAGALLIGLDNPGEYEITVPSEGYINDRTRWAFRRWDPGSSEAIRVVVLPEEGELQLGLEVQKLVSFTFHDLKEATVGFDQIQSLTIKSSVGDSVTIKPTDVFWMRANNVSKDNTGLFTSPVLYSISEVLMSGSNVVNQGQQRVVADQVESQPWDIEVRLFDLRISSRDRLFGFPMGSAVLMEDAAGNVTTHPMTRGEVTFTNLPRGEYKVRIVAPGLEFVHPVVVTRPTDVHLDVLSYVDIAFVGAFGLFCAVVPLVLGSRRYWIRRRLWDLAALAGRATSVVRR